MHPCVSSVFAILQCRNIDPQICQHPINTATFQHLRYREQVALKEIETELHAFFEVLSSFDFFCQQGELALAQMTYDTAPLVSRDLRRADLDGVRDP